MQKYKPEAQESRVNSLRFKSKMRSLIQYLTDSQNKSVDHLI